MLASCKEQAALHSGFEQERQSSSWVGGSLFSHLLVRTMCAFYLGSGRLVVLSPSV